MEIPSCQEVVPVLIIFYFIDMKGKKCKQSKAQKLNIISNHFPPVISLGIFTPVFPLLKG